MTSSKTRVPILLVLIGCLLVPAYARALDADMVAKVEAALPGACTARPQSPRKVLVFNLCRGFVHGSIPLGAKAFELMGQKTGAYETVLSDDIAVFEPGNLGQFDAAIMNNTTGPLFTPAGLDELSPEKQQAAQEREAALKQSLLDFVRGGKGLVGIHAATDCFYEWAEYGEMIGGYFDGHPWGGGDTVGVRLDDPAHPLNAAFRGRGFKITDEIYQIKAPYSRENLRVLLSIDPENTDMTKGGMKRTDGDYAISWLREYGQGRVFYCSLGHNESTFWNAPVLRHYLDGIQYALGDLPADATPSAQLTPEDIERSRRELEAEVLNELLVEVAAFDYGHTPDCLAAMSDLIVASHVFPQRREEMAVRLASLLDAEDTTLAAKQYVCKELWRIGTKETIPHVAPLLLAEDTADMARYALERMADPEASTALREALAKTSGAIRIGIINSLGQRRDTGAIDALFPLMSDEDLAVAEAAILALEKIGGLAVAGKVVASGGLNVSPELGSAVGGLLLETGVQLVADGQLTEGGALCNNLFERSTHPQTRAAALKRLIPIYGAEGAPFSVVAMNAEDRILRSAGADAMREIPGEKATRAFVQTLPGAAPEVRLLMLYGLADRGDAAALPAVVKAAAESDDGAVKIAAIEALAKLGDATTVAFLAQAAAGDDKDAAKAAANSLARLKGDRIDGVIAETMGSAEANVRVQLARALTARYARDGVQTLLAAAEDSDETVRKESFKALRALASKNDLPAMVELLVNEQGDGARREAEAAVVAIAKKIEEPAERAAAAVAAFPGTQGNIPGRCALVRVLAKLGDDSTLEPLREDLQSTNPELQEAAIRALAEWPTPAPLPDLYAIAESGPEGVLRVVALRAYFRLLAVPSGRSAAETVKMYEQGLGLATGVEERKLALGGLADVADQGAVELVKRFEDDPELKAEAAMALEKIKNRGYVLTASHNTGDAAKANDGDLGTRWTTGQPQAAGQWFQIDLGWEETVSRVILDASVSGGDYPRGYEVYVSTDTNNWGEPVASGEAGQPLLEISCEPKPGRYVRIVQTEAKTGLWWSIHELKIDTVK